MILSHNQAPFPTERPALQYTKYLINLLTSPSPLTDDIKSLSKWCSPLLWREQAYPCLIKRFGYIWGASIYNKNVHQIIYKLNFLSLIFFMRSLVLLPGIALPKVFFGNSSHTVGDSDFMSWLAFYIYLSLTHILISSYSFVDLNLKGSVWNLCQ